MSSWWMLSLFITVISKAFIYLTQQGLEPILPVRKLLIECRSEVIQIVSKLPSQVMLWFSG